jgi:outer membrane lipoprotein-sorting protein
MKNLFIIFICCVISTGFLGTETAKAQTRTVQPVSVPKSQKSIEAMKAQDYLQALKTAKARFVQTAYNGSQLTGTFYLNRPGKLRFEYDDLDDFVVADGFFIYFYDAELQEQTNAPIGQTLADFLLRPGLTLDGDIQISNIKRGGDLLQISLVQAADPEAGSIILGFEENGAQKALNLKKWRVLDSIGNVTEVELFDLETGLKLPGELFVYQNPNRFENPRYND